jgi:hypothetical protein
MSDSSERERIPPVSRSLPTLPRSPQQGEKEGINQSIQCDRKHDVDREEHDAMKPVMLCVSCGQPVVVSI